MFALKLQEVVVTAFLAVGEFAADVRAGFVNRTAAQLVVQKLAGGLIDVVRAVSENALVDMVIRVAFGEFVFPREGNFGRVVAELEVFGQAVDITLGDDDAGIAAAVARALAAVVVDFCVCHGRHSIATSPFSAQCIRVATKT